MTNIIFDIIKSFESNSKTKELRYKDFLTHVYKTFDDKIEASKEKNLKNKYKKMRVDILQYILVNEKAIKTEIFKRK